VKIVINTHHHPDHVGNNQKFIDAGAQVVALEALKTRMASDPRTKDIPGLPTQTFAKIRSSSWAARGAGLFVRPWPHRRRHDGLFPDAKVVMVSDQMSDTTPIVDFANGGSAVEWTKILDGVLALDFEMAIPGVASRRRAPRCRRSATSSRCS
jgi:glyoxylase-like metal-dependent hydrolase (beta-lactamase superfamily II)